MSQGEIHVNVRLEEPEDPRQCILVLKNRELSFEPKKQSKRFGWLRLARMYSRLLLALKEWMARRR